MAGLIYLPLAAMISISKSQVEEPTNFFHFGTHSILSLLVQKHVMQVSHMVASLRTLKGQAEIKTQLCLCHSSRKN
jgi:hypothetical protein